MKTLEIIDIIFYTTATGKQPFADWQKTLNLKIKAIVMARVARIRNGNFGDCKQIKGGSGVWELRIHESPGFRIYYGKKKATIIVLLIGGVKGSQERDIVRAKRYWLAYKESQHGEKKAI